MQRRTNIALVPVEGDLDVTNVARLRATLDALIDSGCRRIILNMAKASYVDSAGMGLIIREIGHMRQRGGLLSLTNVRPTVLRALALARVVDFAPVSAFGTSRDVPALDPGARPLWRHAFRIDPCDLAETRAKVADLLRSLPLTEDERFDANLAVGEAMGNAIDHTDDQCALVTMVGYPDRVMAEVTDNGRGCPQGAAAPAAPAALEEPCDGWNERGRGIKLMRMLADSVTISARPQGAGTVVRIVKLARGVQR